jgi:hypothetical protein
MPVISTSFLNYRPWLPAIAFPTDLILGNVQRLTFTFPKSPEVIGIAGLASAFDLFPAPFRSHDATKVPGVHLAFADFIDELGAFNLYISTGDSRSDEFAQTGSMASVGEP